ncbi:hypothetical protein KAFR_0B05680 [Kazachstania africana CBS 2517]|uniref:Methyltransferase small domain-containing protein n=1 Tax=Kazachstania africana (strain ATCC 22294 / BCRC 22015 / CBS 2517 / CECT 1963 / NBRC 1671 / NRRL Y-8276) TaxID=1071382 RepID=H2AR64_KAZAF|nr:hypothetical protein KAFR_0B05680 [Kazachstania africana CBS 2517]CCF56864.1 hypothetical protein KAFR_0B05680 [Kazachstania africana CBS 2517]
MLPTPYVKCDYSKVYEPSEDSFLLLDALEEDKQYLQQKFQNQLAVVCELGPGSGIVTTFLMQNEIPIKNSLYFAVDINPWALETTLDTAKRNSCEKYFMDPVRSSLCSSFRNNEIDLLVFNPPYVPAEEVPLIPKSKEYIDEWLDLALLGGKDGMDVTQIVLDNLNQTLSTKGIAYILFCARNKPEEVVKLMKKKYNWDSKLIVHRKAGWEVLSVYRFYKDI